MVRNLWASCEQSCAYIKLARYGQKFVSKLGAILCLHKLYISCCSRLGKGRGRLGTIYWHSYEEKQNSIKLERFMIISVVGGTNCLYPQQLNSALWISLSLSLCECKLLPILCLSREIVSDSRNKCWDWYYSLLNIPEWS